MKKVLSFVVMAGFCLFIAQGCASKVARQTELRSVISLQVTNQHDFWLACEKMTPAEAPPVFWNEIADDTRRPRWQRSLAVVQLFKKHFRKGMSVKSFGRLMRNAQWPQEMGELACNTPIAGSWPYVPTDDPRYSFVPILPSGNGSPDEDLSSAAFSLNVEIPEHLLQDYMRGSITLPSNYLSIRVTEMGAAVGMYGNVDQQDFSVKKGKREK